jgi:hypothetical protein
MFGSHPTQILVPDPVGMDRTSEQMLAFVLRALAVSCILFGVRHWAPILGFGVADSELIFNISQPQQFLHVSMAVLFFVTMVGLWLMMAWGLVVWVLIIFTEVLLHSWFYEIFGVQRLLIIIHLGSFALYVVALLLALRGRYSAGTRR